MDDPCLPPSLSWDRCSTLCDIILPASKFPCRFPTNDSAHPPLSVLVADCCVFLCFFPITQLPEEWHCFLCPPPLLCFSHTHQSPIMVSADNAWSLPPLIPAPSSLGWSGRPPWLIIVDFSLHPQQQNSQQVVQKIPRHRSGRCSSLISQNGGSID
jgi:hypothetical protein